jgi:IclR family pca regulon transcriptional regulator
MVAVDTHSDKNIVHSLAKGFRVLAAFSAQEPELVLAEVARRADMDNATAFRLLNTLVLLGYVEKVADSRRFRLTLKCLDLGFNAIARADLRTQARPVLRGLVGETAEAASIGVLDAGEVVYVERIQAGLTRLGVETRIGSRMPVHSTAIGQAIIAFLPPHEQTQILEARTRHRFTDKTIVDLKALLKKLREVRARGYAASDQENVAGVCVLAAPVRDADGFPMAAVSVAAPTMRHSVDRFEKLAAKPLLAAATTLSRALSVLGGGAFHVGYV